MKKTFAILSILLTFSFANSEGKSNITQKDTIQELVKQENLTTRIRATRESRVTRNVRNFQRDLRVDREERLVSRAGRESRPIRFARLNEYLYIVKLK